MLVLARKKGQSIMIGKDIELFVTEVSGETVRLGIKAPQGVEIVRTEIYLSLQKENKEALTNVQEAMELFGKKEEPEK